jgi:hypothetical protein
MLEAFHLGGWGMYPTLVSGLVLLWVAARYAKRQDATQLPLVGLLALMTLTAGGLGFVTGFMKTLEAAASEPNRGELIAGGTFESLHNIALALSFIVLSTIVAAVGAWRSTRSDAVPSRIPVVAGNGQ